MSQIHVDFSVGVVSAFYFIIFDLLLLTVVDVVLSRIANQYYYRQINRGEPLTISSTDLPGIATFLVGRFSSLHNIISLTIKLVLIVCIVFIERGIDAEFVDDPKTLERRGTFYFDPSDAVWLGNQHRAVSRRWERVRSCRQRLDEDHTNPERRYHIDFYHIAFDLAHNRTLDNEIINDGSDPIIEINDTTIQCLSPRNVLTRDTQLVAQVVGCSQIFDSTDCRNETILRLTGINEYLNFDYQAEPKLMTVEAGTGNVSLSVITHSLDELQYIFPQLNDTSLYSNPQMTCAKTQVGPPIKYGKKKILRSCLLIVNVGNNTVIERWLHDYNNDVLIRNFPGPVFKGIVDYGIVQRANHLINLIISLNWETLAATLIADAMIYERVNWTFRTYTRKQRTVIPVYAIVLGITLLALTMLARIIVLCTIDKDVRPQINSIDGLSSIAREELQPSGRSMVAGQGVMVGLSHRGFGKHLHFGPLLSADQCVKRSAGELVE